MGRVIARRRVLVLASLLALLAILVALLFWWWWRTPTVAILVRHAERAGVPADDPPLTAAGEARAQELVHVAGAAGVTAIFATEFQRTQQTVAPLAAAVGLTVTQIPAADVAGLVQQIRAQAGGVAVVAGHSNTLPMIIEALTGQAIAPIGEE